MTTKESGWFYSRLMALPFLAVAVTEALHLLSRFVLRRYSNSCEYVVEGMMPFIDGLTLAVLIVSPFLLLLTSRPLPQTSTGEKKYSIFAWLPFSLVMPLWFHAWRFVDQVGPSWLSGVKGLHADLWYGWLVRSLSVLTLLADDSRLDR